MLGIAFLVCDTVLALGAGCWVLGWGGALFGRRRDSFSFSGGSLTRHHSACHLDAHGEPRLL
jgi:hypothetical protein